jgi:hypothetical protein
MKLLLDENLPKKLKLDFTEYEIYTVTDKGCNGIKNGELLKLMLSENFDALLTFDKNLQYKQNFEKYSITVFVYSIFINSYSELTKHSSKVKTHLALGNMSKGPIVISAS